jgi:hypothetical protein
MYLIGLEQDSIDVMHILRQQRGFDHGWDCGDYVGDVLRDADYPEDHLIDNETAVAGRMFHEDKGAVNGILPTEDCFQIRAAEFQGVFSDELFDNLGMLPNIGGHLEEFFIPAPSCSLFKEFSVDFILVIDIVYEGVEQAIEPF